MSETSVLNGVVLRTADYWSRGGNVTLHIRARYKYGRVTYTGYQIATHYVITFVYIACSPYM